MPAADAHAKLNLALVVGPLRPDGKHEVVTVLERLDLADRVAVERGAPGIAVTGFPDDTIVRAALGRLCAAAGEEPAHAVTIEKRIPVAAGLGGGSSDAATALRLANALLRAPLPDTEVAAIAADVGADVPFFLADGPQLATGDGTELAPVRLPDGYEVVLIVPDDTAKESTGAVYGRFDERCGETGFDARRDELLARLRDVETLDDLASLPPNDLASSPLADELRSLGAIRADVTGAGPAVFGLFREPAGARRAAEALAGRGRVVPCRPLRSAAVG